MKYLTFSYDDGVTQDIRLVELFNKYGMKCTFNINSGLLGKDGYLDINGIRVNHIKIKPEDVRYIYDGHEVAGHGLTHPCLARLTDEKIIEEVEVDRVRLSELCGYDVVGFAYPGGDYDRRVSQLIKNKTGIKYCRTVTSTHDFVPQDYLHEFNPTVYHHKEWDKLFELGDKFLSLKTDTPSVFYVWGHAYEFDIHNSWDRFEEFLKMMSKAKDIEFVTNKEALLDRR